MKQGKDYRVLPRKCTGHSKHPLPTTKEKTLHMDITRWSIPKSDWLYSLQPTMESSIQSAKTRLRADCGSVPELLIAKFRLKLKKVRTSFRPFRYDLNQILMTIEWSEVAQLCLTLCDPMDCSLPGSPVHGIFQAIVLEWIAISFSSGSSRPRDWTRVSHIVDRHFTVWAIREVLWL